MRVVRVIGLVALLAMARTAAAAPAPQRVELTLRGRALTLAVYQPPAAPKGTIIMGSGDVGWVGLAVSRAQALSGAGYLVIGVNMREYLSAFTTRASHLEPADIQHDFGAVAEFLRARRLLPPPVILSGVSEGAGIAVVAAASATNHAWVNGVITMGLPRVSEIAWRWSDFTSWITKKDADEPSVDALQWLPAVAPVPLVMLQSAKDEYVSEADYRAMLETAREPKRQILIPASNHRFTDRLPELSHAYDEALAWIETQGR
ncbi:MAG: hypothetical protein JSU08_10080 [Acidobacteria bacterium]|nr:hypothetical protein [Acidobacteriota bacterium]